MCFKSMFIEVLKRILPYVRACACMCVLAPASYFISKAFSVSCNLLFPRIKIVKYIPYIIVTKI